MRSENVVCQQYCILRYAEPTVCVSDRDDRDDRKDGMIPVLAEQQASHSPSSSSKGRIGIQSLLEVDGGISKANKICLVSRVVDMLPSCSLECSSAVERIGRQA